MEDIERCVYCKWYKIGNAWISECHNEDCEFYEEQCIEAVKTESQECEQKELRYERVLPFNESMRG